MNTSPNSNAPKEFTVDALQPLHELELVSLAKQGKLEAFDELIHRYGAKIFRLAYHITSNREDAEDAMQEVFLKSFSHLPQFQGNSKFYT